MRRPVILLLLLVICCSVFISCDLFPPIDVFKGSTWRSADGDERAMAFTFHEDYTLDYTFISDGDPISSAASTKYSLASRDNEKYMDIVVSSTTIKCQYTLDMEDGKQKLTIDLRGLNAIHGTDIFTATDELFKDE